MDSFNIFSGVFSIDLLVCMRLHISVIHHIIGLCITYTSTDSIYQSLYIYIACIAKDGNTCCYDVTKKKTAVIFGVLKIFIYCWHVFIFGIRMVVNDADLIRI